MIVLTIRTDKAEAEVGVYENQKQIAYVAWQAHRELSVTLLGKINKLLRQYTADKPDDPFPAVEAIVCYKGPGSFTGLRVGLSTANAIAYALRVPIVAAEGDDWITKGVTKLMDGQNDTIALPEYGSPVHITEQRK